MYDIIEIINKKRLGESLNNEEIRFVVDGYVNGEIKDYQMSSLLMAIVINGMSYDETYYLTKCMVESGKVIDLSGINGVKVDKHSTGGVGDKITLVVAPIVSLFAPVVKMSGRGLGFTGGTIDKLEAIEGFNVNYSIDEVIKQVNEHNICLSYTNDYLAPADKKIYALRNASATVESIPLIASSIMSKKIASGADDIVIDLKVGNGAFMKDYDSALTLANTMINIGSKFGRKVICILSNMNDVLGYSVGNTLEVMEAMDVLQNKGPDDVRDLSIEIASNMVSLACDISTYDAKEKVIKALNNGDAYNKFLEFVSLQGGNINSLKIDANKVDVVSQRSGYIKEINVEGIGELSRLLGAGRINKEDIIDNSVGLKVYKKCSDYINVGDVLATVYYNKKWDNIDKKVNDLFILSNVKARKNRLIFEVVE